MTLNFAVEEWKLSIADFSEGFFLSTMGILGQVIVLIQSYFGYKY